MKNIYNAPNIRKSPTANWKNSKKEWRGKYPYAILSWKNNREDLIVLFLFPLEIRKIIYTTNLIEKPNGKSSKSPPSKVFSPFR